MKKKKECSDVYILKEYVTIYDNRNLECQILELLVCAQDHDT